jgi:hypothetical protein
MVPNIYPANPPFAIRCKVMRVAYNKAQKGEKSNYTISKDRIERLDKISFRWQGAFEKRCGEVMVFIAKFGHCNVPSDYPWSPLLGACASPRK